MTHHIIKWTDHQRAPKIQSNPLYPQGVDVDISDGAFITCTINLPYPAKRCGLYTVSCKVCEMSIALTTAGRRDDPRSVTIQCYAQKLNNQITGVYKAHKEN